MLSDPETLYVPPEYEKVGNSYKVRTLLFNHEQRDSNNNNNIADPTRTFINLALHLMQRRKLMVGYKSVHYINLEDTFKHCRRCRYCMDTI